MRCKNYFHSPGLGSTTIVIYHAYVILIIFSILRETIVYAGLIRNNPGSLCAKF
jgi:hypothetical protein